MRKIAILMVLVAALLIGALFMLGVRFILGKKVSDVQNSNMKGTPLGTVRLLDSSSARVLESTDITAYNQIYHALGLTNDKLVRWENENGYWSQGKNKAGELLIPGFPIFSKVVWMYITPVDLSREEVRQLIQECAVAEKGADDVAVKQELNRIRLLGEEALEKSATLRFDQP